MGSTKRKHGDATSGKSDGAPTAAPPSSKRHHPGAGDPAQRDDAYYRNLYTSEVNFKYLGKQDPAFAALLSKNGQLDFTDPAAVMQLTKTLLEQDFGLTVELPDDRLCPPVPNRHNYILWLKDLLDTSSYRKPGGKLSGLDIGTGASCIYPLLGTAQRPWNFVATDVDAKSLEYAKANVSRNGLEDRIRLVQRDGAGALVPIEEMGIDSLDFVMTNPPFYESSAEMTASAAAKARPPGTACTGAVSEMICTGGELGFVRRILDDSLRLRECVQWYTSMFGKLESLKEFVQVLRECSVDNWAVKEFVQGNRTKRWAVGWSYGPMRPAQSVARGIDFHEAKKCLPPITEVEVVVLPPGKDAGPLVDKINDTVGTLQLLSWEWNNEALQGVGRARENVWGRAWKRKQMFATNDKVRSAEASAGEVNSEECRLGIVVSVHVGRGETTARLRWVEGHDQTLFESFSGFLKTKLQGL